MRIRMFGVALAAGLGAFAGCSKPDGPLRYNVSGIVTLDGQPIPYGEVVFTPDAAKKNSGPQGIAPIRDGKYDTAFEGGMGIAGGPTIIRVNGMSGFRGQTLCEYEMPVDLPRADGTLDIAVPKSGKSKPRTTPEI
jgi:hypothetical protein